jgi:hypothetical protein
MILAIALTLARAIIDWFIIEVLKSGINHALEEGLFFSAVAAGTLLTMEWSFFAIAYGAKVLLQDPLLNWFRPKKTWDYISQEKDAAWTDRQIRKIKDLKIRQITVESKWIVLGLRMIIFVLACFVYYATN